MEHLATRNTLLRYVMPLTSLNWTLFEPTSKLYFKNVNWTTRHKTASWYQTLRLLCCAVRHTDVPANSRPVHRCACTQQAGTQMCLHTAGRHTDVPAHSRPARPVRTTMLLPRSPEIPHLILRTLNGQNISPQSHTPIMLRILTV